MNFIFVLMHFHGPIVNNSSVSVCSQSGMIKSKSPFFSSLNIPFHSELHHIMEVKWVSNDNFHFMSTLKHICNYILRGLL